MRHFRSFSIIIIESMHMSLTKPMLALIIRKQRYSDMGIFIQFTINCYICLWVAIQIQFCLDQLDR